MAEVCPACGRSTKPREIRGLAQKKVVAFLSERGVRTIQLSTGQIGLRLNMDCSTVATVLRHLEAAGKIKWQRGVLGRVKPEIILQKGFK